MIIIKLKDLELTLEEARELYNELGKLFSTEQHYPFPPLYKRPPEYDWYKLYTAPTSPITITSDSAGIEKIKKAEIYPRSVGGPVKEGELYIV